MQEQKINHVAVWVAAVLMQSVPPLIYSEAFFGIRWAELNQLRPEDFESFDMTSGLMMAFASSLAAVYTMAWIFKKINVESGLEGLKVALVLWFAFGFMELATQNMFTLRPFELTLIDEAVVLISYEIAGAILGSWRKYHLVPT